MWRQSREKKQRVLRFVLSCALSFGLVVPAIANQVVASGNGTSWFWDRTLPNVELTNVDVSASSLEEAWKQVSTDFLIRSVLVVSDSSSTDSAFAFEATRCSARDLLDALTASYSDFTWTQDESTGVIWFHPVDMVYADILSPEVAVANDQLGLPMQSGILEALDEVPDLRLTARRWGTVFSNTFDYPVDVRTGKYSVRDLLNVSSIANPTKTFFVRVSSEGTVITAVNLVSDKLSVPPPGALHLWRTEIGRFAGRAPTQDDVSTRLADSDPRIRRAARMYLEAMIWSFPVDKWVSEVQDPEKALWLSLGLTSVLVRSEEATHTSSIQRMKKEARDEVLNNCNPELAVLTALELIRVAGDKRALGIMSKRKLAPDSISRVASDVHRIMRKSGAVRNAMRTERASWMSLPDETLLDLKSAAVSKLKFSLTRKKRAESDSGKRH